MEVVCSFSLVPLPPARITTFKFSILSIFIISCSSSSDDEQSTIPEFDRSAVLKNYADNIIIPRLNNFRSSVDYLKESGEKVEEEAELSRYATKAVRKSEKYNIDIAFDLNGTPKILHKGIGKVDYESGVLELEGFSPIFVQNNSTEMIFEFGTSEYLLVPKKDQIFSITIDDVIVDPRPFVDRLATSSSLEKASLFDS